MRELVESYHEAKCLFVCAEKSLKFSLLLVKAS